MTADNGPTRGARLRYQAAPPTIPVGTEATIGLTVTNEAEALVTCSALAISPSPDLGDGVSVRAANGTSWTVDPDRNRPGTFLATPESTGIDDILTPAQSLGFLIEGARVAEPGPDARIAVLETVVTTGGSVKGAASVRVGKEARGPGIARFTVEPVTVTPNQEAVLAWSVVSAPDATIKGTDGTELQVGAEGTLRVNPADTTTYYLIAGAGSPPPQANVTVAVPRAAILNLSARPREIGLGDSATVSWVTAHAVVGTLNGDEVPDVARGRAVVTPGRKKRFDLWVTSIADQQQDGGTSDSQSVYVTVQPVSARVSADPKVVAWGAEAALHWTTAYARTRTIEPDVGAVDATGTCKVTPRGARSRYTLIADGLQPLSVPVTVEVAPAFTRVRLTSDAAGTLWAEADATPSVDAHGRSTMRHERFGEGGKGWMNQSTLTFDSTFGGRTATLVLSAFADTPFTGFDAEITCDDGLATPGARATVTLPHFGELPIRLHLPGAPKHPATAAEETFVVPDSDYDLIVIVGQSPAQTSAQIKVKQTR
jgi:hypothetical protein